MQTVTNVVPRKGYRLHVTFSDGLSGEIDLSERLFGPVFESLKEWNQFSLVTVDEFGAVCWPSGADLAPDALYVQLKNSNALQPTEDLNT